MQKIKHIDVCWTPEDYVHLDFYDPGTFLSHVSDYNFPAYTKFNCTNLIYHLPKPMPQFVDKVLKEFDYEIKAPALNLMHHVDQIYSKDEIKLKNALDQEIDF